MKIKVQNAYSDGHESTFEYEVCDKAVDYALLDGIDQLWDLLFQYTGDGHGEDADLGWFYSIDIIEAARSELVGVHWENSGN